MVEVEIVGAQIRFGEHPMLLLRARGDTAGTAIGVSSHQLRALEAAACQCSTCADMEPAVVALAAALDARILAAVLEMSVGEAPTSWLLIQRRDEPAPRPIQVAPVDALMLTLRTGVPLMRAENGTIHHICRGWRTDEQAPEPPSQRTTPGLPSSVRSFLESLDL